MLWINFRGTGKNPGIRLELGKADGFPEKVNCRGYSRWSAGSAGAGNFLDPILDPIQEITCSLVIGIFPRAGYSGFSPAAGGFCFPGDFRAPTTATGFLKGYPVVQL